MFLVSSENLRLLFVLSFNAACNLTDTDCPTLFAMNFLLFSPNQPFDMDSDLVIYFWSHFSLSISPEIVDSILSIYFLIYDTLGSLLCLKMYIAWLASLLYLLLTATYEWHSSKYNAGILSCHVVLHNTNQQNSILRLLPRHYWR